MTSYDDLGVMSKEINELYVNDSKTEGFNRDFQMFS